MTQTYLTVGVAHRPLPGEVESGDLSVVQCAEKRAMIAVIDGVGHGPRAAMVAGWAGSVIEKHAAEQPVAVMRRCNERLRGTRGAAITLLAYDRVAEQLEWAGIGNVGAAVFRRERWGFVVRKDLPMRSGIVGMGVSTIRAATMAISNGDFLVVATDGLKRGFLECVSSLWKAQTAQELADALMEDCHAGIDDALVLVASFKTPKR